MKSMTPQEHIERADWHLNRAEAMGSHAGSALTFATAHSSQAVAKLLQAQVGSDNNEAPKRKAE